MDLSDPTTATLAASRAMSAAGQRCAVYGGLALAVWGEPRETRDADFAVSGADLDSIVQALGAAGLDPQVNFREQVFGGNGVSRIQIFGGPGTTGFNVIDLVQPRSERFASDVLSRAIRGAVRGQGVSVVCPEDFVLLKVLSTRERDLEDAAIVVRKLRAHLDWQLLRSEVENLAGELADCPCVTRWQAVVELAEAGDRA